MHADVGDVRTTHRIALSTLACVIAACAPEPNDEPNEADDAIVMDEHALWPRGADGITVVPVCWMSTEPKLLTRPDQDPMDSTVLEAERDPAKLRAHVVAVWQRMLDRSWVDATKDSATGMPTLRFDWRGRCTAADMQGTVVRVAEESPPAAYAPKGHIATTVVRGPKPRPGVPTMYMPLTVKTRDQVVEALIANDIFLRVVFPWLSDQARSWFDITEDAGKFDCTAEIDRVMRPALASTDLRGTVEDVQTGLASSLEKATLFAWPFGHEGAWKDRCRSWLSALGTRKVAQLATVERASLASAERFARIRETEIAPGEMWSFTLLHEFGHALGFMHEEDRTRLGLWGRAFGPPDPESIMTSSPNPGRSEKSPLSEWDARTVRYYYGKQPGCILHKAVPAGVNCRCPDSKGVASVPLPTSRQCEVPAWTK